MAVKRCRHGLFAYNVNDSFIGRSHDLYGEWCEAELAILGQILRPGDTALDVSANIGTHAVFFAQAAGRDDTARSAPLSNPTLARRPGRHGLRAWGNGSNSQVNQHVRRLPPAWVRPKETNHGTQQGRAYRRR